MRYVKCLGVLVLVAAVTACSTAPAPPAATAPAVVVDVATEEAAVRAISAQWLAFEGERNAAGIAGLFADDGRLIWAGQDPVVGAPAIQAYLTKDYADNPKRTSTWKTDRVMIASAGDLAVEYGNFTITATGKDGTGSDNGNYVTVLRKVGGAWKVVSDASVSAKPTAPASM
jgi:uncharacterized protein (TIGR02246 family)